MRKKIKQGSKIIIAFFSGILVFVGTISVLATWPNAPTSETLGGWLGSIFDLNTSDSTKLIVNSENVTLPNNTAISENKQITTKEYVDSTVSAASSTTSAIGGGASAFVLVGGQNSVPACPGRYSSTMDGYWQCAQTNSGGGSDCFCGQEASYSSYTSWSSSSNGYTNSRCAVCVPSTSSTGITPENTVLYMTKNGHNGDFDTNNDGNARPELDQFCETNKPASLNTCGEVHAFISVNNTRDEIRDLSTCDPDGDGNQSYYHCNKPIFWYNPKYNKYTIIATDWEDMTDGSISNSATAGNIQPALGGGNFYWTGTSQSLNQAPSSSCNNWTNGIAWSYLAHTGYVSFSDYKWMQYTQQYCHNVYPILCACKQT